MLIGTQEFPALRGAVTMVDGCFDPLHGGHVDYFREASVIGLPVVAVVANDEYLQSRKRCPLLPETHRALVVDSNRHVAWTHLRRSSTAEILDDLQPRFYVKGNDWEGRLPAEEVDVCRRRGIEVRFVDTVRASSTRLVEEAFAGLLGGQLANFFFKVFAQKAVPPSRYDEAYFEGSWRGGANAYTLETRREIEGKGPAVLKEVFSPKRVLDVGCGPGILMFLLQELGVEAEGVDFSPVCRELAPPEVRDRIRIGPVTGPLGPPNGYDLVVCREVLEHLTVLQIRHVASAMARVSSRFVYITTRFHWSPADFLGIEEQAEVDPTHITLLHKEFLRVLFVLEGLRPRPDLEQRMDWLRKGRVLVLEKAGNSGEFP